MVDFRKLRAAKQQPPVINPEEIFRRLPKSSSIIDLHKSQAEVLTEWDSRRNENDLVIKLHTGGGKTLVGLLIAQSVINETGGPVMYVCPNVQLVDQIISKAQEYNIAAVAYRSGELDEKFLNGGAVLVCTYQALFNAKSLFGVRGGTNIININGIIFDDAHVAFSTVRDAFTLTVKRSTSEEDYTYLTSLFRADFLQSGRAGTFDDIINGKDYGVLEVPYWYWKNRAGQVREYLAEKASSYPYVWQFLRDAFDYCHCLISQQSLVITPLFPLVSMLPAFANCPRRVFMSATIADDSVIVRTFDADPKTVGKPIISNSLAGISERLILVPETIKAVQSVKTSTLLHDLARWSAEERQSGTVILVPSMAAAESWSGVSTLADTPASVAEYVQSLQSGVSNGPYTFANRYDGIDLPGRACRLLIMSGLPMGISEYDQYRAAAFEGSTGINTTLAQRIEQGIGRGARGAGDYCVVILTGHKLVSWIGRKANTQYLTSSSRAQLEVGVEVGKEITSPADFKLLIERCYDRDPDWSEYHAVRIAELVQSEEINQAELKQAGVERKAFKLFMDGYHDQAIAKLTRYVSQSSDLDRHSKGWLLQTAAQIALYQGNNQVSLELQQEAYAANQNLLRPLTQPKYTPVVLPGQQAETIAAHLEEFRLRRAALVEFEATVAYLVGSATANQFEQALADLGTVLGFVCSRPEKEYDVGPDVLWLMDNKQALVIEAKSGKKPENALTKAEYGQLLTSVEWFVNTYPGYSYHRVMVHPNSYNTTSIIPGETRVLTLEKLNELVVETRNLLTQLSESTLPKEALVMLCEKLLDQLKLRPDDLVRRFLGSFETEA